WGCHGTVGASRHRTSQRGHAIFAEDSWLEHLGTSAQGVYRNQRCLVPVSSLVLFWAACKRPITTAVAWRGAQHRPLRLRLQPGKRVARVGNGNGLDECFRKCFWQHVLAVKMPMRIIS